VAGRYPHEQELRSMLKAEISAHYKKFFFPGFSRYDTLTGNNVIEEPRGLNYDIQKMLLEKSGFGLDKSKLAFFEGGKEDEIPKELLTNGLIVSISERERDWYGKNATHGRRAHKTTAGPTMILHEVLSKAGFFRGLENNEKKELLGAAIFADIIEQGEWLEYTKERFFDTTAINLFKINRLLSAEQLSGILRDMLRPVRVEWSDVPSAKEIVRDAIVRGSKIPLSQDFVLKHHLEEAVLKQSNNIEASYRYLKFGANARKSKFGDIVYVRKDKLRYGDRLQGNLPAIAARSPEENGKPVWNKRYGYFEVSGTSLLGYIERRNAPEFLKQAKEIGTKEKLNLQEKQIGGWVKLFVPFEKDNSTKFLKWLETEGLRLQSNNREQKPKKAN